MTVGVNILSCSQTHKLATFYAAASVMDPGQAPAPIYLLIIGLDDLKRERMRGASRFDTKCRRRRTFNTLQNDISNRRPDLGNFVPLTGDQTVDITGKMKAFRQGAGGMVEHEGLIGICSCHNEVCFKAFS